MEEEKEYFGEVIFFLAKEGYGFISWSQDSKPQKDMFCYWSDIDMDGFKRLEAGQKVSFKIGQNNAGDPKAIEVKVQQ